jgi:hypothetical protein
MAFWSAYLLFVHGDSKDAAFYLPSNKDLEGTFNLEEWRPKAWAVYTKWLQTGPSSARMVVLFQSRTNLDSQTSRVSEYE